ncbi:MAG: hypothetical protein MJZ29_12075 [Bacteroidaceae bacterium]|nr:hypothetical protein [Bacteroidaceae bacterium]
MKEDKSDFIGKTISIIIMTILCGGWLSYYYSRSFWAMGLICFVFFFTLVNGSDVYKETKSLAETLKFSIIFLICSSFVGYFIFFLLKFIYDVIVYYLFGIE